MSRRSRRLDENIEAMADEQPFYHGFEGRDQIFSIRSSNLHDVFSKKLIYTNPVVRGIHVSASQTDVHRCPVRYIPVLCQTKDGHP